MTADEWRDRKGGERMRKDQWRHTREMEGREEDSTLVDYDALNSSLLMLPPVKKK